MRLAPLSTLALLCAPCSVFAQEKPVPPADVDQALRERVSQFMQFSIDRAFSKAYALVADESKDWYLSSGKGQYKKFKIQDIEYSPDFQQATVKTLVTQIFSMQGREVLSDAPVSDIWKRVDGKWMYFHDPDVVVTPFGNVRVDHTAPSHATAVPKDLSQEAVSRAAGSLTMEATTNKAEVVFVRGVAGSEEITVHNGFTGAIDIICDIVGDYGSYAVEPQRSEVQSGKDITLKVSYKPLDRILDTNVRVRVEPFDRILTIPVRLKAPESASSSPVTP